MLMSLKKADNFAVNLKDKLQMLPLYSLAQNTGFIQRKPQKINPVNFLVSFFIMVLTGARSLSAFASTIGLVSGYCVSKQAVAKRIKQPLILFLKSVLAQVLSHNINIKAKPVYQHLSATFNRILLQDSTTIKLNTKLAGYFPGSRNQTGKKFAILKIQAIYDLLSESFFNFSLSAFTRNDQKASSDILSILKAGDLVIRDLGYFVLANLGLIQSKGAFFISRLHFGVSVFKPEGSTPFDLLKALKKNNFLDINVCIGKKEKLPVRLIAIRLPENIASQRRRKAKNNRDRRFNPSKERLVLLGWNIFVLNVNGDVLNPEQVAQLYNCRWRIEIIFKSWKSHFSITNVPNASAIRVKSYIYATLIFITIFQSYIFVDLFKQRIKQAGNQLSLLKVTKFFKEQLWAIILYVQDFQRIQDQIFYHCRYEPRLKRVNHAQRILSLG
jgi:Transposase DDE domain